MSKKEVPFLNDGNVPNERVEGRTIAIAWQNAILKLWDKGIDAETSFDKPADPLSKDTTFAIEVKEPMGEPRFHLNSPGSPAEFEYYRLEVLLGIHDHWITRFGTEWNYTYHERMRNYDFGDGNKIDQLERMMQNIEDRAKAGKSLTRRRFQFITWIPGVDDEIDDPPCLQRLHFRLIPNPDVEGGYKLNLNTHWRSRDGYKAWLMNAYAFTDLQRLVAQELSERCEIPIELGRYFDISDSLHIYGSYFDEPPPFREFLEATERRSIEDLTYSTDGPIGGKGEETYRKMIIEERRILAAQLDYEKISGRKGVIDPFLLKEVGEQKIKNSYLYPSEWDK